ncbi:MAG: tRNA 2-thiouridine(34) synthase MnmA [Rhodanobacteraceae bacterium]
MDKTLVMVGMSGGVDSSVAALLLRESGQRSAGLFMQNWEDEPDAAGDCRADADRRDALAVCGRLGMPFHACNFAVEYRDRVFAEFLKEYRAGRTPNPDVLCNREIKFGTFLEAARGLGAERIATGHYARLDQRDGRWRLLRGIDHDKDQSYFLHALNQYQLAATLFPLGELNKTEVRERARAAALPTHAKKDSTGICFIGERNFRDFLARYLPSTPGEIRTPDDVVIGTHEGAHYYTVGQRNGLGIGGLKGSDGDAWYVVGKNVAANVIYATQGQTNVWLESSRLAASRLTWVAGAAPAVRFRCTAKTRYRQSDQACTVEIRDGECVVSFDTKQRAITPGQSVVFYDDEVCLGGGIIERCDAPFGGWTGVG